jgi:hypothetical protein
MVLGYRSTDTIASHFPMIIHPFLKKKKNNLKINDTSLNIPSRWEKRLCKQSRPLFSGFRQKT